MEAADRKINLGKFKVKKTSILVVTDLAARGIDIPELDNVINFDFPYQPKLYIHRVGRVARNGRTGKAYSFLLPNEVKKLIY
jgi:ATP-dependent RNA helicase DDX54/DBP10